MSREEEKWMDGVFDSMKGSKRAKPRPEVFAKIQQQIKAPKAKVVSFQSWKTAAAVAAVVLFMNVAALTYYFQSQDAPQENFAQANAYGQSLISSYQIYK